MSSISQRSTSAKAPSKSGLRRLARVAGNGEMRAYAIRQLEHSRAAIELEGWLLLQEIQLENGIDIRHGLFGPGGIVVAVPCGPVATFGHLQDAQRQKTALARLLELEPDSVIAALVTMDSDETPSEQFYDGYAAVVVGDRHLPRWLSHLPAAIDSETLGTLRDGIYEHAARAADARPLQLPRQPRWG